jgi:DNA-binding NarL/FixJ family response regulator
MTEAVAIVTASDREMVLAVVRAGACGIIERTAHSTSLARVVRHAVAGEITLPRQYCGYVLDELARVELRVDARGGPDPALEPRARGPHVDRERPPQPRDGRILSISELTVKRHVHNMLEKLRVPTRSAAVSLAVAAERWPPTEAELPMGQARSTTERYEDMPLRG